VVAPTSAKAPFDPDSPVRLHPAVALRDESFGALAYHYDNRRLVFLKSRALVELVVDLEHHECARAAVSAHVEHDEVDAYVAALGRLYDSGVIDGR
jgi:putative mycofactocin binding protein MftB